MKEKFYFDGVDDEICWSLKYHINKAREEGFEKIVLFEAIEDKDNKDYVWCSSFEGVCEKSDCRKSICSRYESRSGRGVCSNRGKLYTHGKLVEFKISDYEITK